MKVTCNPMLEAPLINMIKLYDSLHVKGVCGILTPGSKHNVVNTTIGALALLSYCNELQVDSQFTNKLRLIDITINKGPINYFVIANASGGVLSVPKHLSAEPFAVATGEVSFKLLVGITSEKEPLLEEDVFAFVSTNVDKSYEFTGVPLPLMSKNLPQFNVTRNDGKSIIQCSGVSETILQDLFSSLKVE